MPPVNMIDPHGQVHAVPEEGVARALSQQWRHESPEEASDRVFAEVQDENYGGVGGAVVATGAGALRGATLGASDAALGAIYGDQGREDLRQLKARHEGLSTAGEIGGALITALPTGGGSVAARLPAAAATRLGARIAQTAEGASAVTKIGRAAAGAAAEGALFGAGTGVSELALSDDPLTLERAASVLSSNALYGGVTGGIVGGAAKGAELGLLKAKSAIDKAAATRAAQANVTDDLAQLDAKGLRAAHEAELEVIETSRVPERLKVAEDIASFRNETKEQKIWLATKGAKEREIREVGKLSLDADRAVDRVLKNPKRLAEEPKAALAGLQQQEHALEQMTKKADAIRATFAGDETAVRAAALDAVPAALEKNRALQTRIRELAAAPKSERLTAIGDAKDALAMGRPKERGFSEQILQGAAFSAAAGAASQVPGLDSVPLVGSMIPLLIGAKASKFVSEGVFGRLGKASSALAARAQKAVGAFVDVATPVVKATPVLATRVLASVRYGQTDEKRKTRGEPQLAAVYKARSDEVRAQTAYGPDGRAVMRPELRAQMAERLVPIGAVDPVAADRLETHAARKIEFLANKLPKRPDLAGIRTGPDRWQPSDMAMRTWARYAAAAEDPHGIVERLAAGTITPEDAETMRTVYPEIFADVQRQIVERLPELREALPYARRLALSIFSGVPVDPAMDPRILSVLQQQFADEAGTEGGTQAPRPQAQFGSVKAAPGTRAQERNATT